ncbi:uncharacterized protein LOC117120356 isoform X2 [Anneissia japonica]|nr:uncharacterized protein LOC117120356 isoform X2 [Anneissia japonica]
MEIAFDGIPFMIVSKKVMSCQYGSDKCIAQKRRYREKMEEPGMKKKRRNVVFTKKRDCPAQIRLREVIKFPDYKVKNDSKYNRRVLSRKCHNDMKTGVNVSFQRRIYICLPSPDDHQFHPTHKKGVRMRAAVLEKPSDLPQHRLKVSVNRVSRPEPKRNEVLIKVAATSVSRQDISKRYEAWPLKCGVSNMLGTEAAGTIEKVGDVLQSTWKKGDRVMCLLSSGGNAEYVNALEDHLMLVPDFMSFSAAAAIPEVWLMAYHLLYGIGNIKKGDDVLIHAGASGVGTAAIQLVNLAGGRAIVTAGSWSKVELCKSIGAVAGFNYKEQDFAQEVLQFTEDQGVKIILDCVGGIHCAGNVKVIATDGLWIIYGLLSGSEISGDILPAILKKRVSIKGASMHNMPDSYKVELIKEFKQNILPHFTPGSSVALSPIINKMYALKGIVEAHDFVESNTSMGKVIITLEETKDTSSRDEQTKRELFEVAKSFQALADGIVEIEQVAEVTQKGAVGSDAAVLMTSPLQGMTNQIIELKHGGSIAQTETEKSVQVLLADKNVESSVHVTTASTGPVQSMNTGELLVSMQSIESKNTMVFTEPTQTFIIQNDQAAVLQAKDRQVFQDKTQGHTFVEQQQPNSTCIYTGTPNANQNQLLSHVQSVEQSNNFGQSETVHLLNQAHIEGHPQLIGQVQEVETMETDHLYQEQQTGHQSFIGNNNQTINIQAQHSQFENLTGSNQSQNIHAQHGLDRGFAQEAVYTNQPHQPANNKQEIIFVLEQDVGNPESEFVLDKALAKS